MTTGCSAGGMPRLPRGGSPKQVRRHVSPRGGSPNLGNKFRALRPQRRGRRESSHTRILSRGLPLFEEGSSQSVSALRGHPSSLVETCFSTRRLSETGSALSDPREWGGGGRGSRHTRMLSSGFVYLTRSWCGGYVITVPSRGSRHDKVSGGWR